MLSKSHLYGPGWQWILAFFCGLSAMSLGTMFQWPSSSLPKIRSGEVDLGFPADKDLSWMVSLMHIAQMAAAVPSGWIMDWIGRKWTLLLCSGAPIASWLVLYGFPSLSGLYLSRALTGVWVAVVFTVVPIYLGETMEPKWRGTAMTLFSTFLETGCLFQSLLGSYASYHHISLISCSVPVLVLLGILFAPESPYYSFIKGDRKAAENNLRRLWGGKVDVPTCAASIEQAVVEQRNSKSSFVDIFRVKAYRRAFIMVITAGFFQQTTGFGILTTYGSTSIPESFVPKNLNMVILNAVWLLGCLFGLDFIDRFGRKSMFLISSLGCFLSMTVVSIWYYLRDHTLVDTSATTWLPLFALVIHGVFVSLGLMTVPRVYQGELFPVSLRGNGSAISSVLTSLISSIIIGLYAQIENGIGLFFNFAICAFSGLMGTLFAIFVIFETKGKSLEEIQEILHKPESDCS